MDVHSHSTKRMAKTEASKLRQRVVPRCESIWLF